MASALVVLGSLKIFLSIFSLLFTCCFAPFLGKHDYNSSFMIERTCADIVKDGYRRIDTVEFIRQDSVRTLPYEIGYMVFTINEKYRKMIDRYNVSVTMNKMLYQMELVLYLEEIELLYWEIDHLTTQGIDIIGMFNESIFNELSWTVKLMLLKDHFNSMSEQPEKSQGTQKLQPPFRPPTPSTPVTTPKPSAQRRIPDIESLVVERRQEDDIAQRDPNEDDSNMRIKLFRLMYETVRDSDLKCKRAELIRAHYANSSTFDIGYLMGDVMDKYNIMSDISMTLKRLFHEWKPIEHINAYEQISNQAIEINHLIDMMQGISKKNETDAGTRSLL